MRLQFHIKSNAATFGPQKLLTVFGSSCHQPFWVLLSALTKVGESFKKFKCALLVKFKLKVTQNLNESSDSQSPKPLMGPDSSFKAHN